MISVEAGKLHTLEDVSPKAWNHYGMCLGTDLSFKSMDVNSEMPSNLAYGLWSLLQIELKFLNHLDTWKLDWTWTWLWCCFQLADSNSYSRWKRNFCLQKIGGMSLEKRAIKQINTGPPGIGSKHFIPLRWGTFGETEAAKQMTNGSQGMQMMKQEECCKKVRQYLRTGFLFCTLSNSLCRTSL